MNDNPTSQPKNITRRDISRRDFTKLALGAIGAALAVEVGAIGLSYTAPRVAEGAFGSVMTCGKVEDFPNGSVTPFNEGRFYLVRLADAGFLALYRKCTHLGCAVPWDQTKNAFVCPCHASEFDNTGNVLNAPAPRPLDRFAVIVENGEVKVDTGTPIQRDQFEQSQVTYA